MDATKPHRSESMSLPIWMHSEPTPLSISSATTTRIESTRRWATKRPCKWKKKKFPLGGRQLGDASLRSQHTTANNKNQVALGDFKSGALSCIRIN